MLCFSSRFSAKSLLGGENQKGSLNRNMGYSEKAQRTGSPDIHSIKRGGEQQLTQTSAEPAYSDPNSNSLQKPMEGRSLLKPSGLVSRLEFLAATHTENRVQTVLSSTPRTILHLSSHWRNSLRHLLRNSLTCWRS